MSDEASNGAMNESGAEAFASNTIKTSIASGAVVIFAIVLFVTLRLCTLNMPLDRDEGGFAYGAQRMLLGDRLYRDIWDHKMPGIFLIFLLPVGLLGGSIGAIHATLGAAQLLTGGVLYGVARRLFGPVPAAFAAMAFAMTCVEPAFFANAALTEPFMLLPDVAAIALGLRARGRGGVGWFFAGCCAMASCLIKPVGAVDFALLAGLAVWPHGRPTVSPVKSRLIALASVGLGAAATAAPVCLYFALHGTWRDFVDANFVYSRRYLSQYTLAEGADNLRDALGQQFGGVWPLWLTAALGVASPPRSARRGRGLLVAWLLLESLSAAGGLQFYLHHFIPLMPPLALAAGLGLARLHDWLASTRRAPVTTVVALLLSAGFLAPCLWRSRRFFMVFTPTQQVAMVYYDDTFSLSLPIAAYVARHTQARDSVLIFGSEPQILYHAGRRSATKYIHAYSLMLPSAEALERQQAAWQEIREAAPRIIIMTESRLSLAERSNSPIFLRRRLTGLVEREFELVGLRLGHGFRARMLFDDNARAAIQEADAAQRAANMSMFIMRRKD